MEKPAVKSKNKFLKLLLLAKSKNKFLKLLPRAVSSITFHNLPFSPGKNKKAIVKAGKLESRPSEDHSGQNLLIVQTGGGRRSNPSTYEAHESTSTKISCIGHIKHRKKLAKNMNLLLLKEANPLPSNPGSGNKPPGMKPVMFLPEAEMISSKMENCTLTNSKPGRNSDASTSNSTLLDRAPSLSHMNKQFGSGSQGSIDNFDWRMARIASIQVGDDGRQVGLEPRKEINIWRRRTNTQLQPIEVNCEDFKDILPHELLDKSQSAPPTFEFAQIPSYNTLTPTKFWYF